ncbi:MAG: SCP2 sterol-binding domain-containing protein [Proteobacteria bacterium]|nr:SCP2 sterol-binding domain-containing protein [Pseudomonadota bacterium]
MGKKAEKILFVTSFLPVAAFKIIARIGEATWGQAKLAVVIGFILAVVQYVSARKILKYNTYLEKAFLGFLFIGTLWVYAWPSDLAHVFVDHSVALLYFTLFLMTLLPQLLGYDPFTYAVAKQWYPESVWGTPDFRLLNFRITYVWSLVFFAAFLSSHLGHGKPLYAIVIPFALCIGIGVVFSKKYPDFYLQRKYRVSPEAAAAVPNSAAKLIEGMPNAFDPAAAGDLQAGIQFAVSGEGGGKWVISIARGRCEVRPGEVAAPDLTIETPDEVWVKIAKGEIDRPRALIEGLYKVKGDMKLLARMPQLFGARRGAREIQERKMS